MMYSTVASGDVAAVGAEVLCTVAVSALAASAVIAGNAAANAVAV